MGAGQGITKNLHSSASQDWSRSWMSNGDASGELEPYQIEYIYRIGIYGWRKKCLYCLVLLIMTMLIINISLTIWIIRVLDFSVYGMGKLTISNDGLKLHGESEFLNGLWASEIHSRNNKPLNLESSNNITLNARGKQGFITNQLHMGPSYVESLTERFAVKNLAGDTLFEASGDEVSVHSETLRITAPGGVRFTGSVQTPVIKSEPFEQLRIESPTRSLAISAPEGVSLESRAGDISASCLKDFKIQSKEGIITIDSEYIELHNLKQAYPASRGNTYPSIYQICVCQNGRLFVAAPEGVCEANLQTCEY